MLKIRPEILTVNELLRLADHEVACGKSLPIEWQQALIKVLYKVQDELALTIQT